VADKWKRLGLWFATTTVGQWLAKHLASNVDPILYRISRGRLTIAGPVVIPQLVLTTTGRKSGEWRKVQLAYTDIEGVAHIVASNFGGEQHPAWYYNLTANPQTSMQLGAAVIDITAEQLSDSEKEAVWVRLVENIPNYALYKTRTDRNLKVFRLVPRP
jgi:deazaflavin-dependent oxidoreductase (nitroreductase family)